MKNWKKAIACITIGLLISLISCSAVKMAKKDIQIQKQDSNLLTPDNIPSVPASLPLHQISSSGPIMQPKPGVFSPIKDSLFNLLSEIKRSSVSNGKKLDTGLSNQGRYIRNQIAMNNRILDLQSKINGLQIDTSLLKQSIKQKALISKEVKTNAVVGNAMINYLLWVELFFGCFVVATFIVTLILASRVKRKYNIQ
jgi:hypothetical protein